MVYKNGQTFGRPREHDREDVARQMIEWAKREDSLTLTGFSAKTMIPSTVIRNWRSLDENFRALTDIVYDIIAERRERKYNAGEIKDKAYGTYARVFDGYLDDKLLEIYGKETQMKSEANTKEQEDLNGFIERLAEVVRGDKEVSRATKAEGSELETQ